MKKNLSSIDRIIRLLIAATIVYLYYNNEIYGIVGIVLFAMALVFALTCILGFCPTYYLMGISTLPHKNKKDKRKTLSS